MTLKYFKDTKKKKRKTKQNKEQKINKQTNKRWSFQDKQYS